MSATSSPNPNATMSLADVSRALAKPVRYRILLRYLAQIGLVIVVLKIPPVLVAYASQDWEFMQAQLLNMLLLCGISWPLVNITVPEGIRDNEVMVISALSFVLAAAFEAMPFTIVGLSGIDALFEAVSGVTTTGLSTLKHVQNYSDGVLFTRAWMQWYGGLGVVLFSIALLVLDKGVSAQRLVMSEISDKRDILGNARSHLLKLLGIYSALTLIIICIFSLAGLSPLAAVTYAFSGVSTGGFAISDNSLADIDTGWIQTLVALSGFLGAISLPFYYRFGRFGRQELLSSPEIFALPLLIAITVGLLFSCGDSFTGAVGDRLQTSLTMGLSAQTTTGFATVDMSQLNPASKLSLIISMSIGGCIGSTAGGIKILRLLIMLRLLQFFIARTALPAHAVLEKSLAGDRLEAEEIERVFLLLIIFMATVLCSWLLFLLMGYPPLDALFEVVSACSTTGLSAGLTRVELEPILKLVLIFDMLLGRVEFLAFLVLLYPRTWIKRRTKQ